MTRNDTIYEEALGFLSAERTALIASHSNVLAGEEQWTMNRNELHRNCKFAEKGEQQIIAVIIYRVFKKYVYF
jgi:hypothetical protein